MPVIYLIVTLLIYPLVIPTITIAGEDKTVRIERRLGVMGTSLTVSVEAVDRATALAASERAVRALHEVEARLSTWRDDTELARFNRAAVATSFRLSEKLAAELHAARYWWQETEGAFDPGIGALVAAWGLRSGGRMPSNDELQTALAGGGMKAVQLEQTTAIRLHPEFLIEEGGFGKGAGLDHAITALAGDGVVSAMLDLGGQVAVMGEPVSLDIASPLDRERSVLRLAIDRGAVATSGNSERGIEVDGVRYSHILDPRCGEPAADFGTLTVWAPDGLTADCLSTGLYVMGPDQALAWASARQGIEVLVLESKAGGLRVRATEGFAGRISDLDKRATLEIVTGIDRQVVE